MNKDKLKKQVGRLLRKNRKSLGFSIRETAEALGIKFYSLKDWERGRRLPSKDNIIRLMQFLEYDTRDFIKTAVIYNQLNKPFVTQIIDI